MPFSALSFQISHPSGVTTFSLHACLSVIVPRDLMVLWSNVKSFCAKNKLSIVRSTITRTALLELDITAIGFDNAYYLS